MPVGDRVSSVFSAHRFAPRRVDDFRRRAHALAAHAEQAADRRDRADRARCSPPAACRCETTNWTTASGIWCAMRKAAPRWRSAARRSGSMCSSARTGAQRRSGRRSAQQLHLLRADGRHHQRDQPRAERHVQGAAKHRAGRDVARELLDRSTRVLTLVSTTAAGVKHVHP